MDKINMISNHSHFGDDGIDLDAELHMKIIYLIIGILGLIGNVIVALTLLHFRHMRRNLTNTFIINQSITDGTVSIMIMLSAFIRDVSAIKDPIGQELFCRLWLTNMPIWGIFVSSTYNMVAVTFERYSAVVHPITHQHHFTRRKALIIIAVIWIGGPAYNAAYMIPTAGMVDDKCIVYSIWPDKTTQSIVGLITVLIQYFIPLGLIIFAYACIARQLSRAGSNKNNVSIKRNQIMNHARRNVIKTLALVSICFVVCWSLNQIYYTMFNCGFDADFNSNFYHSTVVMVFCNCCINPFVYAFKYKQFQQAFLMIIGCQKQTQNLSCLSGTTFVDSNEGSVRNSNSNDRNVNSIDENPQKRKDSQIRKNSQKQKQRESQENPFKVENNDENDSYEYQRRETIISIVSDKIVYQTSF